MFDEMKLKQQWVDLQCRGWTPNKIAEHTKSDPKWVKYFLNRNNTKALDRMIKTRVAERAKQVMRLEYMIQEAHEAWENSTVAEEIIETTHEPIQGQITASTSGNPGFTQVQSGMMVTRTKKTVKYQCGQIAYLKAIADFQKEIRHILKIDDGTKRIDLSFHQGDESPIQVGISIKEQAAQELHEWNIQQKERLQALLEMAPPGASQGSNGHASEDD